MIEIKRLILMVLHTFIKMALVVVFTLILLGASVFLNWLME